VTQAKASVVANSNVFFMCLFGGWFDFQTGGGRASRLQESGESSPVISKYHHENFRLRGG
jgi:hypothetical protein